MNYEFFHSEIISYLENDAQRNLQRLDLDLYLLVSWQVIWSDQWARILIAADDASRDHYL